MSANTETTGAARARCHPACGKAYDEYLRSEYRVMFFDGYIRADRDGHVYCSQACAAPPIAAPAAHVERRKGQRWKHVNSVGCVTEWTLDAYHAGKDGGWDATGRGGVQGYVMDTCWSNATITMALLADAPPEPAKACESCGGNESTCGVHGCPGGKIKTCPTCEWAMSDCACTQPAQEAPKAAPVCCTKDKESTVCDGSLLKRIICRDVPPILMCDAHWMLRESRMIEGVKAPYAGPERLPRPQLAADWVEDCLPAVWR